MQRITAVLFVSLLCACSTGPIDDEAGVTTNASGSETDVDTSTSDNSTTVMGSTTTSSMTFSTSGDGDGDPSGDGDPIGDGDGDGDDECEGMVKFDLPPEFEDVPLPDSCTVTEIDWDVLDQYPGCDACVPDGWCVASAWLGCVTIEPGQTCATLCPNGDCLGTHWTSCEGAVPWSETANEACGQFEIEGQCCTVGKFFSGCAE